MKTISVLLILLFATIRLSAQEIILKKPSFPSPKNELLYYLTEDSFFNPDNYNGNIEQLEKRFTEYDQIGNVLNSDTIFIEPIKNYQKFKRISKQPVLDYLGIHKIKKTGKKKFDLYQWDFSTN